MLNLFADITRIHYTPFLCSELYQFSIKEFDNAISSAAFILSIDDNNKVAVSRWVSPKRTRSYPYARIYDLLGFSGKKITIIPVFKDEGKDGDRDFLQWDTISLMSLLNINVIITYYIDAIPNPRRPNKITDQIFDANHIVREIKKCVSFQSDALHWNLDQANNIYEIGAKALAAYKSISNKLNIGMHSYESAAKRIDKLYLDKENFIKESRNSAKEAQERETRTRQPKEKLVGEKAKITIQNYLGGNYYFTADEVELDNENIYLIESKHTKDDLIPSLNDIKDGLIRMILFANLNSVRYEGSILKPIPVLKLTSSRKFSSANLSMRERKTLDLLSKEAETNRFQIRITD